MIDKNIKRKAFNRAAKTYDQYCVLQDRISQELFDRLALIKIEPKNILDLGAGTGANGLSLKKIYKHAQIINYDFAKNMLFKAKFKQTSVLDRLINNKIFSYVCGDLEAIPFRPNTFDLIWSSSTLQWCNNLPETLGMIRSILKPGGLFIFSSFGPGTLIELKNITMDVANVNRTNEFVDIHDFGDMLLSSGLSDPVLDMDNFVLTYSVVDKLFNDIKNIGATSGFRLSSVGLGGKTYLKKIKQAYEQFRENEVLPATYEVIYGHAWHLPKNLEYQPIKFKYG